MTFYLKYRPQTLEELDSVEVRESLKRIVSSKEFPHAFLFAGPKGTGKTSAARILAKIFNCESKKAPCGKCEQCISIMKGNNLDVVELDAASHRGIDDVRSLRDAVKLSPARAKKKVYIIDEAHMLTVEASTALLKTLEEPPAHVVFILATTNPEKLIATIRSRTTEIIFRKASIEEIEHSLEKVIKGENIKIDKEIISLISQESNGSFRDAVKALERYALEGDNFLISQKKYDTGEFTALLLNKEREKLLGQVQELEKNGISIEGFIKDVLEVLRVNISKENVLVIELLIEAVKQMNYSPIEELPLEIAIVKWCHTEQDPALQDEVEEKKQEIKINGDNFDDNTWRTILARIRPINASIEALLRSSKPIGFDGKTLTLGVYYRFHKERLEDGHHRRILEDVITDVVGTPVRVICILTELPVRIIEEVKKEPILTENAEADIIKVAEEIFGV